MWLGKKYFKISPLLAFLIIDYIIFTLFSVQGDASSYSNSIGSSHITIAFFSLLNVIAFILILKQGVGFQKSIVIYYLIVVVFGFFSLNVFQSIFFGIKGLLFTFLASGFSQNGLESNMKDFLRFSVLIFIPSLINAILANGDVQLGIIIVFWLVSALYYLRKRLNILGIVLVVFIGINMHSHSGLLAAVIAFLFVGILHKRWLYKLIAIGCFGIISMAVTYLIGFFQANLAQDFLGKPAGAYLTGSGRFDLFIEVLSIYQESGFNLRTIFGYGYNMERLLLRDSGLTWTTDPHNSMLRSLVTGGYLLLGVWLSFILGQTLLFIRCARTVSNYSSYFLLWSWLLIVFYGFTSSHMLANPTQMIFIILSLRHGRMEVLWNHRKAKMVLFAK